MPRIFSLPQARLDHRSCMADGDDACVYRVTWQRRRRWRHPKSDHGDVELRALRGQLQALTEADTDLVGSHELTTAVVRIIERAASAVVAPALVAASHGLTPPGCWPDEDAIKRLRGVADQAASALQNARLIETVRHQAQHDGLTGLPNRARFMESLEQRLAAGPVAGEVAVLFCDLDDFKQINDQFGHAAGDEVLRQVATRPCTSRSSADPTRWSWPRRSPRPVTVPDPPRRSSGEPQHVAVNLSAQTLLDPQLVTAVRCALAGADLDPALLTLEVVLAAAAADRPDQARPQLGGLAGRRRRHLAGRRRAGPLAGARQRVVAEGVETDRQLTALMAAGYTLVQGYLFGRPAALTTGGAPDLG